MDAISEDMTDNYNRHGTEGNEALENEAGASPPANAANGEATGGGITNEERYRRLGALIKPDMEPSRVWPTLEHHGWVCKRGTGLVSFYYVCSKYADESIGFITKNAKHGDEYFCSEDEVRDFCRNKLGWFGRSNEGAMCNDVSVLNSEDNEGEEGEQWNLIAIHRASDIREGKYKCAGCRDLVACSVWTKMGGSFGDQWHGCVDCQSRHFDLEGRAFPSVKSGDLPSSLDVIADSYRAIIAEMCSTKFRPCQILPDLPTKGAAAFATMTSSESSARSSPKTPARRAATQSKAAKASKTPKKQLTPARSTKSKTVSSKTTKKNKKTKVASENNLKATKAKEDKAAPTPAPARMETLGREKLNQPRRSTKTHTTSVPIKTAESYNNDGPVSNEERYRRLGTLIKPDMESSLIWPTLEHNGWVCKPGKGLVSFIYVCSKFADDSLTFIEKNAKRGDEYFCSEDEVREFCREKLGWVGGGSDGGHKNQDGRRRRSDGRASRRHQETVGSSNAAIPVETTPATKKKRTANPEAQHVPHANAKRRATESNRHAIATGASQELRFTYIDAAPSTPSIKKPSESSPEATFHNVLKALASPTQDDTFDDVFESAASRPGNDEANIPQKNNAYVDYDSDATVPKPMP